MERENRRRVEKKKKQLNEGMAENLYRLKAGWHGRYTSVSRRDKKNVPG